MPVQQRAAATAAAPTLEQWLRAQPAGEAGAWQALASSWGVALPAGADACATLPREGLRCYRNRRAGLNLVRQIDRPVLLSLYVDDDSEAAIPVALRALEGENATLEGAGRTPMKVPVAELAQLWRGEIATLWRAPPALPERGEITDTPAGAAWLDRQLTRKAGGKPMTPAQRQAQIHRFQLAQGVTPDGRAGPLTLMLLNRATGVNEPRLLGAGG